MSHNFKPLKKLVPAGKTIMKKVIKLPDGTKLYVEEVKLTKPIIPGKK